MVLLFGSCPAGTPELLVNAPTRVVDDGRQVRVVVSGVDARGQPARGAVGLESSAGLVDPPNATFADGVATFEFSCDRRLDAACAGKVTLTAVWARVVATREVTVAPLSMGQGGGQAGAGQGGGLDEFVPDVVAGGIAGGAGGGVGGPDAGGGVDAGFTCDRYDGGVHPGYTRPDGGPLALGCDGEPIDAVFIESGSATKLSVCGTVELSQAATMPVFPRSSFRGAFTVKQLSGICCTELRCLRNPSRVSYRFELEAGGAVSFGAGARSDDFSFSQFGYYAGTSTMPLTSHDAGTLLLLDAGVSALRGIDFGVGRGKRDGDP